MLAVLSGVIGNAAYDTIKLVVRRIKEQTSASSASSASPDYLPLLELSDEQLGKLVDSARTYCNDFEGVTDHVRDAIIEELVVDTIAHNSALATDMKKLMERKVVKPKHRRQFAKLLRMAIAQRRERNQPDKAHYLGLWSKVPSNDEP